MSDEDDVMLSWAREARRLVGSAAGSRLALAAAAEQGIALAQAGWRKQRGAALGALERIGARVGSAGHPRSGEAVRELKGLSTRLQAEPATLAQVDELERWLGSDRIVHDVCELAEDIRLPLRGALAALRQALSA